MKDWSTSMFRRTISICSGYFNPLGQHHIDYFEAASKLGKLIVIVNNDKQVSVKGSHEFQDEQERLKIVRSLKYVDEAFLSIDEDGSVVKTLEMIYFLHPWHGFVFCNGGDRKEGGCNSAEEEFCKLHDIELAYNVGGSKAGSSSWTLKKFIEKYTSKPLAFTLNTTPNIGTGFVVKNQYQDLRGCISEYTCPQCRIRYVCDTNKAKNNIEEAGIKYIYGPCCCGYVCPKCWPKGWEFK